MLYCPGVNRRHFLLTSLTGAIAAPRVVAAQRAGGVRRIVYLGNAPTTPVTDSFWDAFVAGLQEHGWVQPRSIVIERRYLELGMEPAIAAVEELSRIGVEVIVVSSMARRIPTTGLRPPCRVDPWRECRVPATALLEKLVEHVTPALAERGELSLVHDLADQRV